MKTNTKFQTIYTDEMILKCFENKTTVYDSLTISNIANKLNCCLNTSRKRLNELVELGLLKKAKIGDKWVYWKN